MMDSRLQITFRDCEPSSFAEHSVRRHFAKLRELGVNIESAHVVLCIPHNHQTKGNHRCVHLQLNVPGKTLVVDRPPRDGSRAEDMYAAIHDAFGRARRLVLDHKERTRPSLAAAR